MRNGKIARLPESVRNELNPRMEHGESGVTILEWLNGLPVVQTMLREEFDRVPISKQNLHEWRQGGFREWELKEDLFARALGAAGMNGKIDVAALIGDLMAMIAAHFAGLMLTWDGEPEPKFEAKARMLGRLLRNFALIERTTRPKVEAKRKPAAEGMGMAGLLGEFQALLAMREGGGKKGEPELKGKKANCPGGTLLREDATARQAPSCATGIHLREDASADKPVALPGTGGGSMMEEVLAKVVELKMAGAAGSGPVKPGNTGSNQKIDFSVLDERVYASRISP